jgi:hypothetical protein
MKIVPSGVRAAGVVLALALLASPAVLQAAEVNVGGYFSLDFLRGQAASASPHASFENVQAGIVLSGAWTQRLGYALEIRSKENMRFEVEQAWAGLAWSDALQIKVGVFLVPFGRFNVASRPYEIPLVEAPAPIATAFPASWRELGVLAEGRSGFLRYAAWIGNGLAEARDFAAGQQFRDNNADKAWGGRLGLILGAGLEVGASIETGRADAAGERKLKMTGADAAWTNGALALSAEYCRSEIVNPAPYAAGTSEGWFVLGAYDLGSLRAVVSYQKVAASDAFHGPGFAGPLQPGLGFSDDRRVWTFGATASLGAGLLLKAQYDRSREPRLELENNIFRAQIAARF